MSDNSVRKAATDAEIDRALAGLTDAAPSPALHASVMRRVAAERARTPESKLGTSDRRAGTSDRRRTWDPASAGFEWRVAVAAAAVVLIAVSVWLAVRPVSVPPAATERTSAPDITLPAGEPGARGVDRRQAAAPEPDTRASEATSTPRRAASARRPGASGNAGAEAPPAQDLAIPALPAPDVLLPDLVQVAPLPDPAPVTMTPVSIPPIEIPEIEIRPIDEPPGSAVGPAKQDPNKNPAGAAVRGPAQ